MTTLATGKLPRLFTKGRKLVLAQLAEAWAAARDRGTAPWDFAVEIANLVATGLNVNDLRWLAAEGYLEHAVEISQPEDSSRRFRPSCNLGFHPRTCFVLTDLGLRAAESFRNDRPGVSSWCTDLPASFKTAQFGWPPAESGGPLPSPDRVVPSWDPGRRVLCVGQSVVKHFRVPAPAQEAILRAFEEEGWPSVIDDPLPPLPDQHPKRRLRTTLQSLNNGQKSRLLIFRGDGSGERILWELVLPAAARLLRAA